MRVRSVRAGAAVVVLGSLAVVFAQPPAPAAGGGLQAAKSSLSPWKQIGPLGGFVESVAVDPTTPSNVYIGLNDGGVFKSTDSGSRWALSGLPGTEIRALAVDPTNDTIVYAGSPFGLYTSSDGGSTWTYNTTLGQVQVNALTADPSNGSNLFVASQSNGVYQTSDGGSTWTNTNNGLTATQINDLVVAPSNPTTLYAATPSGVFTSTNSGGSWLPVNTGLTDTNIQSVAVDPADANSVWAINPPTDFVTLGFHSTTGGATWSSDSTGLPAPPSTLYGLENVPLLVTSTSVYVGIPGSGLYQQPKTGGAWLFAGNGMTDPDGLSTQRVFALGVDPSNSSTLYAGSRDGGMFASTDAGSTWAAADSGLLGNFVSALAGNPANQNLIYAATANQGLFVSSDSGKKWSAAQGTGGISFNNITLDPSQPDTVWAGGAGIYTSTDNGSHWTGSTGGQAGLPAFVSVTGIAPDPFNTSVVWASLLGHGVYETINDGTSWSAVNTGLTDLNDLGIAADPNTPGLLYVATESSGVFTSTNGGSSWSQMTTTGLPSQTVLSIADNSQSQLSAGTQSGLGQYVSGEWVVPEFYNNGQQVTCTGAHIVYKPYIWGGSLAPSIFMVQCYEGFFVGIEVNGKLHFESGPDLQKNLPAFYSAVTEAFAGDPSWLVGTLGNDIVALSSKTPLFSSSATSKAPTGSVSVTVPPDETPEAIGSVSVTGSTGKGKVAVDDYFANPSSVQTPSQTYSFFGAALSSTNTFQSATIDDCQLTDSSTTAYWLNGTSWVAASNQTFDPSTGCVSIVVNATTTPGLTNLKSGYFANIG